jgi:hypothetical protein
MNAVSLNRGGRPRRSAQRPPAREPEGGRAAAGKSEGSATGVDLA